MSIKSLFAPAACAAGGYHNLILTTPIGMGCGQVISWGAGDYGQLGLGFVWDEIKPTMINGLRDVVQISAGLRHSFALTEKNGATELFGYNFFFFCMSE